MRRLQREVSNVISINNLIVITGPTACGKTRIATKLAARIGGEILSADSRQVYRRMDIGTGKDLKDYEVDGKQIPYHLIDIAEPGERYNLYRYLQDFHKAYEDIVARGKQPILCGGTGLYIEGVLKGYLGSDEFNGYTLIGISIPRELRRERITQRLYARLEEGMVDEVKGLLDEGVPAERLIAYGLEYKYLTKYILGEYSYDEMVHLLEIAIHQFAKRQMTWFRGMERRGFTIDWRPYDEELNIEVKSEK